MKNVFFKDVSVITVSKIVTALISFLNTALLSRFRTLTEYGTYSQMLLAISLAITICDLGLPYAITFFGSKTENTKDRNHFFSVFYTVDTMISLLIGILMIVCIPLFQLYFHNDSFPSYWYFLLLYPWISVINGTIEYSLVIAQKSLWIAIYRIIYGGMSCLVAIIVKLCGFGFDIYLISYTVVLCILTIAAYVLVSKSFGRLKIAFDMPTIKKILVYSLPIGLASAVGTINIELDKLVIGKLCSTEELAVYTNASKALPVGLVATVISMVIMPQIVKKIEKKQYQSAVGIWNKSIKISLDLISVLTIALIVFAPEVITFIYSSLYVSGKDVFRIYCIGYFLGCAYWGTILNATGKTKSILYCSIISCVVNVILDIILYTLFGTVGPAIATVLSQFVLNISQLLFSEKTIHLKRILDIKSLLFVLLQNIVLAVPFSIAFYYLKKTLQVNNVLLAFVFGSSWIILYLLINGKRLLKEFNDLNTCDEA